MPNGQPPIAEDAEDAEEDEAIDRIVPPLASPARLWATLTVALLVLLGVVSLPATGVLSPRLTTVYRASCGAVCAPDEDALVFELRNEGWVGADIAAIDAGSPGLDGPTVQVQAVGAPYTAARGPALALPVHLEPGDAVLVGVRYAHIDCAAIDEDPDLALPVEARGPLGLPVSVGVRPGEHARPSTGVRAYPVGRDPLGISWAAGITWPRCHPAPSR